MQHEEGGRNKEEGRRKAEDERREMGEHILDRVLLLYESFARKPGWRFTARFNSGIWALPGPGRLQNVHSALYRVLVDCRMFLSLFASWECCGIWALPLRCPGFGIQQVI